MRRVERIETVDGVLHLTLGDARRHAEKAYGSALSKMAGELVRIEKYGPMQEFLHERLDDFRKLAGLRKDVELEGEDED